MSKNEKKQEEKAAPRKKLYLILLVLLAIAAIALVLFLCLTGDSEEPSQIESTSTQRENAQLQIDTTYITLYFPGEYIGYLQHEQFHDGNMTSECFSLVYKGTKTELFRIYFGNEALSPEGYLHTEQGPISVSVVAANATDAKFANEEARELYYRLLEQMNDVIATIRADARFNESSGIAPETQELAVYDWTLTLPSGVECEQTQEGDILQAEFYGTVGGQRVKLYTIIMGDTQSESVIGFYRIDGVDRPVSVQPDELAYVDGMSEEEQLSVFALMETLNDVVQSIMSSENFMQDSPVGE